MPYFAKEVPDSCSVLLLVLLKVVILSISVNQFLSFDSMLSIRVLFGACTIVPPIGAPTLYFCKSPTVRCICFFS